ncbi:MAG: 4-alpha-glucanotransferase [Desulfovibrionaceae bacterium]
MKVRGSGILLHISSLPEAYGIGDLGPMACRFVDMLALAGQSYWQMLPVNPTQPAIGNSPYSSFSAFAGNPLFISPKRLVEEGIVSLEDIGDAPGGDPAKVDYPAAHAFRERVLRTAFDRHRARLDRDRDYIHFMERNDFWLEDYCLFVACKARHNGAPWTAWPDALRDRDPDALAAVRGEMRDTMEYERFVQYLFFRQWMALKRYSARQAVRLVGDLPIYVTHDSADVWAHRRLFKLDGGGHRTFVAGVPPDYFSATGQLWGNPVYDWDALRRAGFDWWVARIGHNLRMFDIIRLDHFRGFAGYWEIAASEETAMNGRWVDAPGHDLFTALARRFAVLPIIAEDLGVITPDVRELKARFGFPGMKVLQFGFDGNPDNPDAPHNHEENCVVYSGTHDNNTARGWFEASDEVVRNRMREYVGGPVSKDDAHWYFLRHAMMSVARTAIVPMQDVLGLSAVARMNTPGVANGNWTWRLLPHEMVQQGVDHLARMASVYARR